MIKKTGNGSMEVLIPLMTLVKLLMKFQSPHVRLLAFLCLILCVYIGKGEGAEWSLSFVFSELRGKKEREPRDGIE